ncbi:class I SAM-dependent methyltransferase [Mucilaginibacter celer]|uniref:Methyltransferase domain-containing protein n=1 Tax=Mucilaginibacter celer TaxID=2305508 RepID=A0A494VJ59_9SPHI|nr:class I SAM-dependent methyltransferase [Mucilaginibacter celer]AYL94294.1 methyltransferase domain-containing protein [Mucilaginibacter celer]
MKDDVTTFKGSVPQNYEDYLGPFLFEDFAKDLAGRVSGEKVQQVLELASGTGRLTRHLLEQLPASAQITASDLNPDMLEIARSKVSGPNLSLQTADMLNIPFPDESFDLVVCQFGIMLVPGQEKALQEIYRVLKKGGKLVYSVWGDLDQNGIWKIGAETIRSFLGIDPIRQNPGPFSMQHDAEVLDLMKNTGFTNNQVDSVRVTGETGSAALAAKGFIHGLPVFMIIKQRDPALLPQIEAALAEELVRELGDAPLRSPLLTLVFEGTK